MSENNSNFSILYGNEEPITPNKNQQNIDILKEQERYKNDFLGCPFKYSSYITNTCEKIKKINSRFFFSSENLATNPVIKDIPMDQLKEMETLTSQLDYILRVNSDVNYPSKTTKKMSLTDKIIAEKVIIEPIKNGGIRLLGVPFVNKKYGYALSLYHFVKEKLENCKENLTLPTGTEKIYFIFKRYINENKRASVIDNDNSETRCITNAVCDFLNFSDTASRASFIYTAVLSDVDATEILVIPQKNIKNYIEFLEEKSIKTGPFYP